MRSRSTATVPVKRADVKKWLALLLKDLESHLDDDHSHCGHSGGLDPTHCEHSELYTVLAKLLVLR